MIFRDHDLRGLGAFGDTVPSGAQLIATEGQSFGFPAAMLVYYGVGTHATAKQIGPGITACSNATFGTDPYPGAKKSCYTVVPPIGMPAGIPKQAAEWGTFTLPYPATVFFGTNGRFRARDVGAGSYPCDALTFGPDPAYGQTKACYANPQGPIATVPQAPLTVTPTAPVASDPMIQINALAPAVQTNYNAAKADLQRAVTASQQPGAGVGTNAAAQRALAAAQARHDAALAFNAAGQITFLT